MKRIKIDSDRQVSKLPGWDLMTKEQQAKLKAFENRESHSWSRRISREKSNVELTLTPNRFSKDKIEKLFRNLEPVDWDKIIDNQ